MKCRNVKLLFWHVARSCCFPRGSADGAAISPTAPSVGQRPRLGQQPAPHVPACVAIGEDLFYLGKGRKVPWPFCNPRWWQLSHCPPPPPCPSQVSAGRCPSPWGHVGSCHPSQPLAGGSVPRLPRTCVPSPGMFSARGDVSDPPPPALPGAQPRAGLRSLGGSPGGATAGM